MQVSLMIQTVSQENSIRADEPVTVGTGLTTAAMADADMTRIKYGAWLIVAAFVLLGVVFGVAVWRYTHASAVVAVVGSVATVAGTILGAFFGAQVGSAGKEAAEARRAQAERTARLALGKLDPQAAEDLIKKL